MGVQSIYRNPIDYKTQYNTLLVRLSVIKERMAEMHGVLSEAEALVNHLIEKEITSENYSELSDVIKLMEIFEASFRNKRQLMSIKLRKYYMDQYIEKRKEQMSAHLIKGN